MTPTPLAPVGLPAAPAPTAGQAEAPLPADFMALLLLLLGAGTGLPQPQGGDAEGSAVADRERPVADGGPSTAAPAAPAVPAVVPPSGLVAARVAGTAAPAAPAPPPAAAAERGGAGAPAPVPAGPRPAPVPELPAIPAVPAHDPSGTRSEPAPPTDPGRAVPRDDVPGTPATSAGTPSVPVASPDTANLPVVAASVVPDPDALRVTVRGTPTAAAAGAAAPPRPATAERAQGADDKPEVEPGPGTAGGDRIASSAAPPARPVAAAPEVPTPKQPARGRQGETPDVTATAVEVMTADGAPAPARPAPPAHRAEALAAPPPAVDATAVAGQVVRAARLVVTEGITRLRVDLEPPELGAVRISADARGEALALTIVAERPETQALLVQALPDMQRALGDRGLGAASVAVLTTPDFGEGRRAPERRQSEPRGQSTPHPDDRRRAAPRVPRRVSAVDITV